MAVSVSFRDLFLAAWRETRRRPWRFAACSGGYAVAVATAVLLLSVLVFSQYIESGILSSTGTHFIVYAPACMDISSLTSEELALLASGTRPARCADKCKECTGCNKKPVDIVNEAFVARQIETKLLPFSVLDAARKEPGLYKGVSPYLLYRFRNPADGHRFTVGGFDPDDKTAVPPAVCSAADLVEGAFLHANDTGVAVVEQGYAVSHGLRVGSNVTIAGWPFIIIGIVAPGVRPAKADVYLTFADAEKVISRNLRSPLFQEMNVMLVEVAHASKQDAAIARMREIVQSGMISTFACAKPAAEVLGLGRGVIVSAALLLGFLAAAFGLKSQLASLRERRRELGILRSIGWPSAAIVRQLLLEAAFPGILGGLAGAVAAAAAIPFVSLEYWTGVPARVDFVVIPGVAALSVFLAVAGGLAAGLPVGWLAVRTPPAEQLRSI
ncbi:MAG TPA: ABC transporter permease [Candidatus Ozemobacteraceae bacterium]|nr:ABC transporter permease [Candidatus Ozemobacteraceae bacterium]